MTVSVYSLARTTSRIVCRFLAQLGPLRIPLLVLALLAMALAPGGDRPTEYEGFGLFLTVILPTLAPLLLTGLLLDSLMCRVVMGDHDPAGQARLRLVIRTNLFVALLLVLSWLPFFLSIIR